MTDEQKLQEIELLQTERLRHLSLMRDLSVRTGFVALTFSGVLLLSAINARSRIAELTSDHLTEYAESNGEVLRVELTQRFAVRGTPLKKPDRDRIDAAIRHHLADEIRTLSESATMPPPAAEIYFAIAIMGLGIAGVIHGLIGSTLTHIDLAKDLEDRMQELHKQLDDAVVPVFDQWPHGGVGPFTNTFAMFLGIGLIVIASKFAAVLLLFPASAAIRLEITGTLPTFIVTIVYLIRRTLQLNSRRPSR